MDAGHLDYRVGVVSDLSGIGNRFGRQPARRGATRTGGDESRHHHDRWRIQRRPYEELQR